MPAKIEARIVELALARSDRMLTDLRLFVDTPTGPGSGVDGFELLRSSLVDRAAALGAEVSFRPTDPRPEWLYEDGGEPTAATSHVLDTAVCRREAGSDLSGRPFLLAGHLDTVHPARSSFRSLTIDPDGHRAIGPGCSDMKGGLVIAIHALEVLDSCDARVPWTLLLNADEETGSFGSAEAIRAEAKRVATLGGFGLAVEPSLPDGGLVDARGGSGQFIVRAFGKSAHVGRAFESGASAVVALAGAITRIAALAQPDRGLIVNIGPMRGGATTNSVPDRASAWGNIRFPENAGAAELESGLRAACAQTDVPGTRLELDMVIGRPAKPRNEGTSRLCAIVSDVGRALDIPVDFSATGGVCDGNLMQEAGLPTLDTLGVVGGGLHTADEWIDLHSMPRRCAMLALTMLRASRA